MNAIATALLAQTDDGSPTYVVAAVLSVGAVLLVYLAIVAIRVRNQAVRLEAIEERLQRTTGSAGTSPEDGDAERAGAREGVSS
ncbi:MAG: hypothetical protein AB7G37_03705 [Solirubrobacteraceae bacterium]